MDAAGAVEAPTCIWLGPVGAVGVMAACNIDETTMPSTMPAATATPNLCGAMLIHARGGVVWCGVVFFTRPLCLRWWSLEQKHSAAPHSACFGASALRNYWKCIDSVQCGQMQLCCDVHAYAYVYARGPRGTRITCTDECVWRRRRQQRHASLAGSSVRPLFGGHVWPHGWQLWPERKLETCETGIWESLFSGAATQV